MSVPTQGAEVARAASTTDCRHLMRFDRVFNFAAWQKLNKDKAGLGFWVD